MKSRHFFLFASTVLTLSLSAHLPAADLTWSEDNEANTVWTDTGVWTGKTWANGDSATFNDDATVNLGSAISQTGITIADGKTLTLNNTGDVKITGDGKITGNLTKTSNTNLRLSHSGGFDGTLTVEGQWVILGSNANDPTGQTSKNTAVHINSGGLILGSAYNGKSATIGALSGSGSVRTDWTDSGTNAARTLIVNQDTNTTYSGDFVDSHSGRVMNFQKQGSGTLTLTQNMSHTGSTMISDGILELAHGASLSNSSEIIVEGGRGIVGGSDYPFKGVTRGGTLYLRDDSGNAPGGKPLGTNTLTMRNGTLLWFSGSGADTVTIDEIKLESGFNTIAVAPTGNPDVLKIGNLVRENGATVEFRAAYHKLGTGEAQIRPDQINGTAIDNTNGILGGWAFVAANTDVGEFAGQARFFAAWDPSATIGSEVGSIIAATPDFQTSTAAISGAQANENWLVDGDGGADNNKIIANLSVNSLIVQGDLHIDPNATLTIESGGLLFRDNNFWIQNSGGDGGRITSGTDSLYLQSSGGSDQAIMAIITDNGEDAVALYKSGAGTVRLDRQNTYTGGTVINQGTLELRTGGQGGAIRGTATVNAGGTLMLRAGDATGWGGGADALTTINLDGGTLHVNTTDNQTFGKATINMTGAKITGIAGSNIDLFGGGAQVITHASEITSEITLPSLKLRQNDTKFIVADGVADVDLLISSFVGNGDAGNHNLIKQGAGTMVLNGNNIYTGHTTIEAGVLELGANGKLYNGDYNNSAVVTVKSGATWRMANYSYEGVGQLADYADRRVLDGGTIEVTGASHGSGQDFTVTANGGTFRYTATGETLTLKGNNNTDITLNGNLTFDTTGNITVDGTASVTSAIIAGTGGITKTGEGTLTLADNNTYTGATTVNAGTLVINGSNTSAVTVASGATLMGNGGTTESVTVAGTLAPGNSPGAFSIGGDLDLGADSRWLVEIGGAGIDSFDRVLVDGKLSAAGDIVVSLIGDFSPELSDSFQIATFGSFADSGYSFDFNNAGLQPGRYWDTSRFSTDGTISIIPETSAALLGALGLLGLLRRRRQG